jgi:type I restriction enzyme S subunit
MKPYPKYKPSGIEWIGEIPNHWKTMRLKYAALVQPSNVDKKSHEDELPVLLCNYVDVYKNNFIDASINFMEATAKKAEIEKFKLKIGDVIITKDSETPEEIAVPALVKIEKDNLICGYHLTQIRSDNKLLVGSYLFYHFLSKDFNSNFEKSANGVTRFALSTDTIDGVHVLLPEIAEQTAIANFLDKKTAEIDELIDGKQKLIELLKEERTAIINQAVTKGINPQVKLKPSGIEWLGEIPIHWQVKKLKYVAGVKLGKMLTPEDKGGYFLKPYLRAANLQWLKVDANDIKEMWFAPAELNKLRLQRNDLLVSEGGEVGRTCIWEDELTECYIQNSVHKVTFNVDHNPRFYLYMFYMMGNVGFFDSIVNRISIGHLTGEKLADITIGCPPLKEQNELANFIANATGKIDSTIFAIEKEIELMQEYRTALISEVVTGKVKIV